MNGFPKVNCYLNSEAICYLCCLISSFLNKICHLVKECFIHRYVIISLYLLIISLSFIFYVLLQSKVQRIFYFMASFLFVRYFESKYRYTQFYLLFILQDLNISNQSFSYLLSFMFLTYLYSFNQAKKIFSLQYLWSNFKDFYLSF